MKRSKQELTEEVSLKEKREDASQIRRETVSDRGSLIEGMEQSVEQKGKGRNKVKGGESARRRRGRKRK